MWKWDESKDPRLEPKLRAAVHVYSPATFSLSELLIETGRMSEARGFLQERCAQGELDACLPLAGSWDLRWEVMPGGGR